MTIQFLWGDEDYLIEEAINKIKKEFLGGEINELNYKSIDNPPYSSFLEILRTNAMMFGDIVIVIKCEKYFLETKQKEKLDDKQTNELIKALNNLSDRVHFVFVCQTPRGDKKKPDSRKKLYKEILKLTKPQEFPSYRNYEEYKLIPVIKKMASLIGLKINPAEASMLVQTTGASLRDLSMQLEKLKLYIYPKDTVDKASIKELACSNSDIYTLVDYILAKDYSRALGLIAQILQKEHYLPSLAFIQATFSNLVQIKVYSSQLSSFELAKKLNQNEFIVKKNLQKLSKVDIEELIRLRVNLIKAEYNLKSGVLKDPITAYQLAFLEDSYA